LIGHKKAKKWRRKKNGPRSTVRGAAAQRRFPFTPFWAFLWLNCPVKSAVRHCHFNLLIACFTTCLMLGCVPVRLTQAPGAVGRVVDAHTGEPVARASVTRLGDWPRSALTKTDGTFSIQAARTTKFGFLIPPVGVYVPAKVQGQFEVSAAGYCSEQLSGSGTADSSWRTDFSSVSLHKTNE
jgi:hypothetical protein